MQPFKFILFLLVGLTAKKSFGQYAQKMPIMSNYFVAEEKSEKINYPKAAGVLFWSDDFSTASNWTINNAGQTNSNLYGWDIGSTEQSWYFSSGINSTSDGNYAEVKNGSYTTNSQLTNVTYNLTNSEPINVQLLASTDQITLSFLQYGALFNDAQEVQISVDGSTFVTVYSNRNRTVFVGNNTEAIYPNPDLVSVNLAPFITGNANYTGLIWIRFAWTSRFPAQTTSAAWTTCGWFIDDLALTTNPDFDIQVTSLAWSTNGLRYYQIPLLQIAPIDFSVNILNNGSQPVNDVKLNVSVNGNAVGTSNAVSVAPLATDSLALTTGFTPSGAITGTYTVSQTITSSEIDDIPINNAISDVYFSTTDYIYARDNNVVSGTTYGDGTSSFETGNLFEMYNNQTVTAINVRLAGGTGGTPAGTEVYTRLYGTNNNGDFVYVGESDPFVVANANLNTNLVIPLQYPVELLQGKIYLAVVGSYDPALVVANAGITTAQSSFYLDGNNISTSTLFYQKNVPYVRLNFDPTVGILENQHDKFMTKIYPNPATDNVSIFHTLSRVSDIEVVITDLAGKEISMVKKIGLCAGEHTISIDTSRFEDGIYSITLTAEESKMTRKFVKK